MMQLRNLLGFSAGATYVVGINQYYAGHVASAIMFLVISITCVLINFRESK